jgi:hypothetical protein
LALSLGKTNYLLHALMERDSFEAMGRFLKAKNKLTKAAYILTPSGVRERMDLTQELRERR